MPTDLLPPGVPYLLTTCPDHGTRECDHASARPYYRLVRAWRGVPHTDPLTSPWWCCALMVLDPHGVFGTMTGGGVE